VEVSGQPDALACRVGILFPTEKEVWRSPELVLAVLSKEKSVFSARYQIIIPWLPSS
jgi:hypothetical protein